MVRWVSFFEVYGVDGESTVRLGTGRYEEIRSRETPHSRVCCYYAYPCEPPENLVRLCISRWDEESKAFISEYGSKFEKLGGPFWLVHSAQDFIDNALPLALNRDGPLPQEGCWVTVSIDHDEGRLISANEAWSNLSHGSDARAVEVVFQGPVHDLRKLATK